MAYDWAQDYARQKRGSVVEYYAPWEAIRMTVCDKMFGMIGEDNKGTAIMTLKAPPETCEMLRAQYQHISPGYYMNKRHWVSIDMAGDVPDEVVKALIDGSYDLIARSLTKKQRESLGA